MEPNEWLLDADAAVALVQRVIDDIDEGGEDAGDALLCELLYVAWGSLWAQNQ
jgi:hypothetical protein